LQGSGTSLSRFVAGQTHLESRDKQEVDHLLQILLLLTDQFHPDDAALVEATDPLIRRIMALCLQTKLDSDFLEVFTNPSGSHLAPLGLLTEANKVFRVIKKARGLDSKSLFPAQHTPSLPQSSRVVQVHQTGQQMAMPHMVPQMYAQPPPHYPQFAPMLQLPPPPLPPTSQKTQNPNRHPKAAKRGGQAHSGKGQSATSGARPSGQN
jgi:hypothetical protein